MQVNEEKYILTLFKHLEEGVLDMPDGTDLENQLEILSSRLLIAKRMLGLTNKLQDPAQRKTHRSRVMGFLNQIRGAISRVMKQLEVE